MELALSFYPRDRSLNGPFEYGAFLGFRPFSHCRSFTIFSFSLAAGRPGILVLTLYPPQLALCNDRPCMFYFARFDFYSLIRFSLLNYVT